MIPNHYIKKWLFHQTSIKKWLLRVPGLYFMTILHFPIWVAHFHLHLRLSPWWVGRSRRQQLDRCQPRLPGTWWNNKEKGSLHKASTPPKKWLLQFMIKILERTTTNQITINIIRKNLDVCFEIFQQKKLLKQKRRAYLGFTSHPGF